jgi:NADH-quinone oxidoreductase subunit H
LADLNIAVLYFVALGGIGSLAIFMAGWSSGNRYALFGAMRAVAQLLSYEIPIVIALVGVVLLAGSMSMVTIADSQKYIVYLLVQPIGFFVFFLGSLAEVNRAPFDVVEAESELIAGYHIEYSGIKFALFQAAEFGAVLVTSAIIVNLFLGGWSGPFLSTQLGALWFLMKVVMVVFIFEWIRATIPRLRVDQIMAFAWKCLFPLSLINLLLTTLEVYFFRDPVTGIIPAGSLWIMAGINIIAAFVCIPMFGYLIKDKLSIPERKPKPVTDFTIGEAT